MTDNSTRLRRKLLAAGWILLAGLAVEGATLQWAHPTSFVLFIVVGGVLVLGGIVIYLVALITA